VSPVVPCGQTDRQDMTKLKSLSAILRARAQNLKIFTYGYALYNFWIW